MSPSHRTLVLVLAAVALPQGPDPTALITAAERELKDDHPEYATLLLWRAEGAIDPLAEESSDRVLRSSIQSLLEQADPLHARRTETRVAIAGEVVDLARAYVRKKWYRTARDLLDTASTYDRATAAKVVPYVEKQLAKFAKPEVAEVEETEPAAPADLLANFDPFTSHGAWKYANGILASPPLDGSTQVVLTKAHQHADHRVAIDLRIGDKKGSAAFAFGVVGSGDYLLLELYHTGEHNFSMLSLYSYDADEGLQAKHLAGVTLVMRAPERADFVTLEVLVRGAEVEMRANGRGKVTTRLPKAPRGGVGLLVPSNSPNKDPVEFRNLRIDPLPTEQSDEEEVAPPGPEEVFLDAVAAARKRLGQGETEETLRELREIRRGLAIVESETTRAGIASGIDALLDEHDPCARPRAAARVAIAEQHAALAEEYRSAKRLLCARHELRAAAVMHAGTAREPLARLEEELEPILRKELGLAAGPEEPIDDAELIATFGEGRQHWAMGAWDLEPGAVRAPTVQDGAALLLAPEDVGPTRAARVQFKVLEGDGGAGLVFAARSPDDFWVALVTHGAGGSSLNVTRWFENEWSRGYHQTTLRFSKAARESFMTLAVEVIDGGVRVRAGEAEPYELKIDEPLAGRFGLLSASDPQQAVKVAFRNFRSLDDEGVKK